MAAAKAKAIAIHGNALLCSSTGGPFIGCCCCDTFLKLLQFKAFANASRKCRCRSKQNQIKINLFAVPTIQSLDLATRQKTFITEFRSNERYR